MQRKEPKSSIHQQSYHQVEASTIAETTLLEDSAIEFDDHINTGDLILDTRWLVGFLGWKFNTPVGLISRRLTAPTSLGSLCLVLE